MNYTNRVADVEAEVSFFATDQGGRQGYALSGYRPHHLVREDYLTSGIHKFIGKEKVYPGETVQAQITFISPEAYPGCLWVGKVINFQEGSRVVGHAKITKIMNKILEASS